MIVLPKKVQQIIKYMAWNIKSKKEAYLALN